MELAGIEVVFVERCAVRQNVISLGDGLLAEWHIVAVYEIRVGMVQGFSHSCICSICSVSESLVKLRLQIVYLVPSHSWYLVFVLLRLESLHIHIEDADAIYIAFFRMSAQELLSHAYSQDGLCERLNGFVEPACLEIKHGFSGLSLPGKERKGRRTNPQELYGTMNIELIPAIDIIGGQCVRLTKGDYDQKKVYDDNPAEVAKHFEKLGFKRLHVVDLDGAKSKHIVNDNVLKAITSATSLTVDFGGGIKTEEDIEKAFDAGAAMVTVGSIAVTNPELFLSWIDKYGAGRLILGADVRNGKISINGWKEDSAEDLLPFLKQYTDKGVRNVLCTEISKDGTLQGPAIELYKEIMAAYPDLHLIASGGVSCNEDIEALETAGIPAVVFGKAFYEGKIDIDKLGL